MTTFIKQDGRRWTISVFEDDMHIDTLYGYDSKADALAALKREYPDAPYPNEGGSYPNQEGDDE